MKSDYRTALKNFFRVQLIQTRDVLGLTQAKMAKNLLIEDRSYVALESGDSCCSALTFVLFLVYYCPNPTEFLNKLRKELEEARSDEA